MKMTSQEKVSIPGRECTQDFGQEILRGALDLSRGANPSPSPRVMSPDPEDICPSRIASAPITGQHREGQQVTGTVAKEGSLADLKPHGSDCKKQPKRVPSARKLCRYGDECRTHDCKFGHPTKEPVFIPKYPKKDNENQKRQDELPPGVE